MLHTLHIQYVSVSKIKIAMHFTVQKKKKRLNITKYQVKTISTSQSPTLLTARVAAPNPGQMRMEWCL